MAPPLPRRTPSLPMSLVPPHLGWNAILLSPPLPQTPSYLSIRRIHLATFPATPVEAPPSPRRYRQSFRPQLVIHPFRTSLLQSFPPLPTLLPLPVPLEAVPKLLLIHFMSWRNAPTPGRSGTLFSDGARTGWLGIVAWKWLISPPLGTMEWHCVLFFTPFYLKELAWIGRRSPMEWTRDEGLRWGSNSCCTLRGFYDSLYCSHFQFRLCIAEDRTIGSNVKKMVLTFVVIWNMRISLAHETYRSCGLISSRYHFRFRADSGAPFMSIRG